jgi:hypothetical protein
VSLSWRHIHLEFGHMLFLYRLRLSYWKTSFCYCGIWHFLIFITLKWGRWIRKMRHGKREPGSQS